MTKPTTVADALWALLESEGTDVVFGHPGGAILPAYDALHRRGRPRHVLVRHEQAAGHAADGYARATGRTGVCITTSGPGATNLVTGLATAMMDSVPVVAVTGQVATAAKGTDAFQETDVIGVTMPVTKHGYSVDDPADLPGIVRDAFRLARSGRPGPVLIDLPKDVQNAPFPGTVSARRDAAAPEPAAPAPAGDALDHAARLISAAQRPVVMAGRGVVLSDTGEALLRLADRADIPVVTTLLGLDGFPSRHPLALGMPGMHGTERANHAIQQADVLLGLGLRFDDRVTGPVARFAEAATIIHADIAATSVGKTITPDLRLVGDLRRTLPALLDRIGSADRADWLATLRLRAREVEEPDYRWSPGGPLTGRDTARAIARHLKDHDAAIATDVGQHQMWLAQELTDAGPGTHLTSGGLGTMGYALPAALGAALGRPDRPTWVLAGDGGFQMMLQELATVVDQRLPLRIAVLNNGFLGMVRQWQELFYERRYSATPLSGPDFIQLANAYGIPARAATEGSELLPTIDWAESIAGPSLIDLRVVPEENVYPMVPPGAAIDEMVSADAEKATA